MFRYRLRSLLFVVTVFAVLFGWIRHRIEDVFQQRQIIADLEDAGCMVSYWVPTDDPDLFEEVFEAPGPAWLRGLMGDHFFSEGITVDVLQPLGQTALRGNGCITVIMSYGKYDDIRKISKLRGLELVVINPETTGEAIAQLTHDLPGVTIQADQSL